MPPQTNSTIKEIIQYGESVTVEFKSSFDKEVIETLSAFANSKGGSVYIGISNRGQATGCTLSSETLQNWANKVKMATAPAIIPDIEPLEFQGKTIARLSIQEYPVKPVSCKGKYYKRIHNANHQLSLGEISNLHLQTFNTSWDHYENGRHGLDDISLGKVNNFINLANKTRTYSIGDSPLTVLKKFDLVMGDKISNGCFLLFANRDCFTSTIEIGRFSDEISIKDSLTVRTDLFSEVDLILDFLQKHMNRPYIFTGKAQRVERWEYPLEALREIVINMIVHRDYMNSSDSVIKIFNDHIEFYNPGKIYGDLSIHDLLKGEYASAVRNKQVATIFKEAGIIEKYGSGIKRIIDNFVAYGLPVPEFKEFQDGFKVTAFLGKTTQEITQETTQETTQEKPIQEQILDFLRHNPHMTRNDLTAKLDISSNTVKYHLNRLKTSGKLVRTGSTRYGKWQVTDK